MVGAVGLVWLQDLGPGYRPLLEELVARGLVEVPEGARVVAMSALLTSSMNRMRQIVRQIQKEDFGWPVRIILGGGPITPSFARELNVTFGGSMVDTTQKANAFSLDFTDGAASVDQ